MADPPDVQVYRTLMQWEVEEFLQEVQLRRTIWMGKDLLWVRRHQGENQFALKFVPQDSIPRTYILYVKTLNTEDHTSHERYVSWLLSKFTGYTYRKSVEDYLTLQLQGHNVPPVKVHEIARWLCGPSVSDSQEESQGPAVAEDLVAAIEVPTVEQPVRSKYLLKLLGKRA